MLEQINSEIIKNNDDVFIMLDEILEKREAEWWTKFYSDKEKPIPFFHCVPDENLVSYFDRGILKHGRALDVGCGNGRNSVYLASRGFDVQGIDFSETSIEWAIKTTKEKSVNVNFKCQSIFDYEDNEKSFDFIYDAGCFHHIKPHKREKYLNTILKYLKEDGYYAMTCFNLKGGSNISDYDVYREYSMHGGIGFTDYKLKTILEQYFEIIEFREMLESANENVFGKSFLWTVLLKKKS